MKYLKLIISVAALSLAFSPSLHAKTFKGFNSTITQPVTYPVKLEIGLSEDMAYRAEHLPKKMKDRGSARGLSNGFAGNGYYGMRDLNRLTEEISEELNKALMKQGIAVSNDAQATLKVTLVDARPNRPTFEQMSHGSGLSYQSFGNGGVSIKAELIGSGGENAGDLSYGWYDNDIEWARTKSTWSDAKRAINKFARKTAKSLKAPNPK